MQHRFYIEFDVTSVLAKQILLWFDYYCKCSRRYIVQLAAKNTFRSIFGSSLFSTCRKRRISKTETVIKFLLSRIVAQSLNFELKKFVKRVRLLMSFLIVFWNIVFRLRVALTQSESSTIFSQLTLQKSGKQKKSWQTCVVVVLVILVWFDYRIIFKTEVNLKVNKLKTILIVIEIQKKCISQTGVGRWKKFSIVALFSVSSKMI